MPMMTDAPLEADPESACGCCGRTHRKLVLYKGRRVGKSCRDNCRQALDWGVPTLAGYSEIAAKRAAAFLGLSMDFPGRYRATFA